MAAKPLIGTVVYLTATGHVLAAVTSGALEPTVEDLAGAHLRVRVPNEPAYVNVPSALLAAKSVEVTKDVLDRPQAYVFNEANTPALSLGLDPQYDVMLPAGGGAAAANKKLVMVWQTSNEAIPEDGTLDAAGNLPGSTAPAGTTAQLVAWQGGALFVNPYP